MEKRSMYRTAVIATDELTGMALGEVVSIVQWHDFNDTYTVCSVEGLLQCMIPSSYLSHFVL
jgi:hypothetical protein